MGYKFLIQASKYADIQMLWVENYVCVAPNDSVSNAGPVHYLPMECTEVESTVVYNKKNIYFIL